VLPEWAGVLEEVRDALAVDAPSERSAWRSALVQRVRRLMAMAHEQQHRPEGVAAARDIGDLLTNFLRNPTMPVGTRARAG
jgi:hypothetical protein